MRDDSWFWITLVAVILLFTLCAGFLIYKSYGWRAEYTAKCEAAGGVAVLNRYDHMCVDPKALKIFN